jgi:hypothetical protein
MALTPDGSPYVESSDLVANYPAVSLAVANKIDTKSDVISPQFTGDINTKGDGITTPSIKMASPDNTTNRWEFVANVSNGVNGALSILNNSFSRMAIAPAGDITGTGLSLGSSVAYTPTIGGTGWALGNGTMSGSYNAIGKIVKWNVSITWGSTSTFGAGFLTITLPATSVGSPGHVSQVNSFDISPGATYAGTVGVVSSTVVRPHTISSTGLWSGITTTTPFTWAASDNITLSGIYERA